MMDLNRMSHVQYGLGRTVIVLFEQRRLVGVAVVATCLVGVAVVCAGIGSSPPAARPESICLALGTEAPCATDEIGHVKGVVHVLAQDTTHSYSGVLYSHGHLQAVADLGAADEITLLERVNDADMDWSNLLLPSSTWLILRALAHVDEGVGVLQLAHVGMRSNGTTSEFGTTAKLRVRIALVALR